MSAGTLHIVATPIGNLADVSPRALEALGQADLIACEDTRTSRTLLARHGITARVVPLHAHNERAASERLLGALRAGKNVSLISDAGTPAICDPGALLVAAAHREGIRVVPVPGPNAALAAYSASGFAADSFLFVGFLPAARGARRKTLAALEAACPVIIYEAPHRVLETVQDLCERFGGARELLLARELTKKFEELARMPLAEAGAWLLARPHRQQGEFVLILGPDSAPRAPDRVEGERVLSVLLQELPASDAARLTARITGLPRAELYALALGKKGKDAG